MQFRFGHIEYYGPRITFSTNNLHNTIHNSNKKKTQEYLRLLETSIQLSQIFSIHLTYIHVFRLEANKYFD